MFTGHSAHELDGFGFWADDGNLEVIDGSSAPEWQVFIQTTKSGVQISTPPEIKKWMDSGCRLASLRLDCFLVSFRGKFLGHGFLELFSIHSVAFGGVHENVVAACGGSLISRIQQADFQKQLAEFGLVICADLLGQKFLCGRRVLLRLYLVPLRQSRDLAVGEMADQVVGDRQQVGLL